MLLVLDATYGACEVVLASQAFSLHAREARPRMASQTVLPMIRSLLNEAQVSIDVLKGIAFGCGPGSFVGVRLIASVVQGIAFAKNLPVYPLSSLALRAQSVCDQHHASKVAVIQDAQMQEVYAGFYERDAQGLMRPLVPDEALKPNDVVFPWHEAIGVGDGFEAYAEAISIPSSLSLLKESDLPLIPSALTKMALDAEGRGLGLAAEKALPVYLRATQLWKEMPHDLNPPRNA